MSLRCEVSGVTGGVQTCHFAAGNTWRGDVDVGAGPFLRPLLLCRVGPAPPSRACPMAFGLNWTNFLAARGGRRGDVCALGLGAAWARLLVPPHRVTRRFPPGGHGGALCLLGARAGRLCIQETGPWRCRRGFHALLLALNKPRLCPDSCALPELFSVDSPSPRGRWPRRLACVSTAGLSGLLMPKRFSLHHDNFFLVRERGFLSRDPDRPGVGRGLAVPAGVDRVGFWAADLLGVRCI